MGVSKQAWLAIAVGGAAVAAAVAIIAAALLRQPRIEGATPQDRVTSICLLADEQPFGAGDVVAEAAAGEPDPSVRQAALVALARFADPRHRRTVEKAADDPSAMIRAAAATTLGVYQDEAAADRLGRMATADPEVRVRLGAVTGLGRNSTSLALVWLLETAEKDPDAHVQFMAIKELHRRLGMKYIGKDPSKEKDNWPRQAAFVVEYLKEYPPVQEAYAKAGRALVPRPEYRPTDYVEPKEGGRPRQPEGAER
jgi:hypothetical protein